MAILTPPAWRSRAEPPTHPSDMRIGKVCLTLHKWLHHVHLRARAPGYPCLRCGLSLHPNQEEAPPVRPAQCAAGTAEPSACGHQNGRHMKWYKGGTRHCCLAPPTGYTCAWQILSLQVLCTPYEHNRTPWPAEALPTPRFMHAGHACMPDLNTTPLPSWVCSPL